MTQNPSEYVELAIVSILSALVYLYVVHPILKDINPILTFNSNGSGLGILSMAITITILSVAYSVSKPIIRFLIHIPIMFVSLIYSLGPKLFIAQVGLLFLRKIPNKYMPEKFHPEDIDLHDLEDRHK